jgi:carbohydrate binding domain protein
LGEGDVPGLTGDGTKENPYNIEAAQQKQDGSIAWVQGYIVGTIENYEDPSGSAKFATPFTAKNNLLIAASATEMNVKNCVVVQLSSGTELYTKLNLAENSANLGHVISIQGSLEKFYGFPGVKSTTAAILDGKEIGEEQGEGPANAYINESFKSSLGEFKSVSVSGTLSWINDFSSAMIKGGSAEAKFPSETWLVAPTIDLTKETEAYITFKHAINYADAATIKDYHQLMISKDYNGDVSQASWTNLSIVMASGNSFTFVSSGNVSIPADFIGQNKVTIALKYTSTEITGSTWEVQNFIVAPGKGEEIVDPEPPVAENTKDTPYDVIKALTLTTDKGTAIAWVKGYIVGGVKEGNDANVVDTPEDVEFGVSGIRNSAILIAASKEETDYRKCLVIGFSNDSPAARPLLNLVDHPENLGKEVVLLGTLKYAFGAPGMKTITECELLGEGGDPEPIGENLLINPGFEDWTGELPMGWDNKYNTGEIVKEVTIKHSGNNSLRQKSQTGTNKIQQEVAVEGGKKYRLSYWFLDNDPKARSRYWFALVDEAGKTVNDLNSEIQQSAYSVDNSEWQQVEIEITLPKNVVKIRYELRTYRGGDEQGTDGGYIYYDDMELVEIK